MPARSDRIPAIDALRGVAILGILLMNVTAFAMPYAAYLDPRAWGVDAGANAWVFRLDRVFVAGKMIGLLSMLFGAGLILRSSATTPSHVRRMLVLLAIGLLHAYLLWYGDILVAYAVAGLIVFPLRKLPPTELLIVGCCGLLLTVMLGVMALGTYLPLLPQQRREAFAVDQPAMAAEVAAYRGTYADALADRVPRSRRAQTVDLITYTLPQVVGLMALGMGLMKLGLITGQLAPRRSLTIAAIALPVGWSLTALTGLYADAAPDDGFRRLILSNLFEPIVSGIVAVGYAAALVPLFMRRSPWPLVAIGRTALSCYLMQTLICTSLFYGYGLGWFGHVDRVHQLWVVLGLWILQLILASLWLRFFKLGPMEWLWRSLAR